MAAAHEKILVFGSSGQLARSLGAIGGDRIVRVGREDLDLERPGDGISDVIRAVGPTAVVNASGWTAVDLAETEPDRAWRLNADAPREMAEACRRSGARFVHVSTDYVFDGAKTTEWLESDTAAPLNAYGRTKLAGEQAVLSEDPTALVIRTSWVVSEYGRNFVRTMLGLADRAELRVVDDQRGVLTDARELARFTLHALDSGVLGSGPDQSGLLHFRNAGEPVSWAALAREIFEIAGGAQPVVVPITTAEFGAPAQRPANSTLNIARLESVWGWRPETWRDGLARIIRALA